jgi:hypothetical protein
VLDALGLVVGQRNQRSARCPVHDDRSPSLSIGLGRDGRVLLRCHAGCDAESIVAAMGLTMADLHPRRTSSWGWSNG